MTVLEVLEKAKIAKNAVARLDKEQRKRALLCVADSLQEHICEILQANEEDVRAAKDSVTDVMLDRLSLNADRITAMADGIRAVANLPDVIGSELEKNVRPNGLVISKISVPIGVVAIIYESRPNVTSDAAALCIKSGNACVLRAGKQAHSSAMAIVKAMRAGLEKAGVCPDAVNIIEETSRDGATCLMRAKGYVDLLIPRGGAGLIKSCVENALVPCIETGTGICHIYVDKSADINKALDIIENAKCSRPSVCNAMEVCLVHSGIAEKFLPLLWQRLVEKRAQNKVTIAADERVWKVLCGRQNCVVAGKNDFDTEFLDYKAAVKVVNGVEQAIEHIAIHSTHHSESIITEDESVAQRFCEGVDSAAVYVNASTRFTDGGEFGLGCEMGISTQKLHARGPMGLKELTTYKYVIRGNGNIRK